MGTRKDTKRKRAHHPVDASHALEIVFDKITEANIVVEILLPALDTTINTNGNVTLLADGAAEAAGLVASSNVSEGISQIVEFAASKELGRHVVLEPENLGDLHLDAHLAADVLEELMVGGVDLFRLLDGAVVEPQNNVAVVAIVVKVRACNGNGLVGVSGKD
jgi:hypothetical protein